MSKENLRRCIVGWVIETNQPFDTVEHRSFKRLIACATGSTEYLFSRATTRRDIERMHDVAFNWITELIQVELFICFNYIMDFCLSRPILNLQTIPGKLSFTADIWSSKFKFYPFMGVTLHWVTEDFKLKDLGLYYHLMNGPHTGVNIAESFIEILVKFGAINKVSCLIKYFFIFIRKPFECISVSGRYN